MANYHRNRNNSNNNNINIQKYIDQQINQVYHLLSQKQSTPFYFPGRDGTKGEKRCNWIIWN